METLLNNRPRKALNFETPLEVFTRLSTKMLCSGAQRCFFKYLYVLFVHFKVERALEDIRNSSSSYFC
ncbi:hypothetical protein RHABOEDO_001209 [Candidatus Rhabdochlamydia oedothoracis]|uniref:Transposase n=1 Tax=Candidatus Rhabdochlamydia oedothoracis TaxID=2720720 RepID=A0ABX8V679_9BACT|nr:hypothetical protein [Candidatus Rhabdochlamydia oedothoracis]QYF48965.1 hypothetical protein RHABOEDO_001209 [Candidatus Rhabdochlamydia oedothoracis]